MKVLNELVKICEKHRLLIYNNGDTMKIVKG